MSPHVSSSLVAWGHTTAVLPYQQVHRAPGQDVAARHTGWSCSCPFYWFFCCRRAAFHCRPLLPSSQRRLLLWRRDTTAGFPCSISCALPPPGAIRAFGDLPCWSAIRLAHTPGSLLESFATGIQMISKRTHEVINIHSKADNICHLRCSRSIPLWPSSLAIISILLTWTNSPHLEKSVRVWYLRSIRATQTRSRAHRLVFNFLNILKKILIFRIFSGFVLIFRVKNRVRLISWTPFPERYR